MAEENLEQNVGQGAGQTTNQSGQNQQIDNQQGSEFSRLNPDDFPEAERDKYKEWQTKYTQTRQQETAYIKDLENQLQQLQQQMALSQEKVQQFDTLASNPSFQNWVRDQYNNPGGGNSGFDNSVFDEFEGGEALKALADAFTTAMDKRLAPLEQALTVTRNDAEFQGLVNIAKEKGWPDPAQYRESIEYNMKRYNMPVHDAYQKAIGQMQITRGGFGTRQPINQQTQQIQSGQGAIQLPNQNSGIPIVGDRGNVITPPGSTKTTTNPISSKTALELAIEEKNSGQSEPMSIEKVLNKVIGDMNQKGANIDPRDL